MAQLACSGLNQKFTTVARQSHALCEATLTKTKNLIITVFYQNIARLLIHFKFGLTQGCFKGHR